MSFVLLSELAREEATNQALLQELRIRLQLPGMQALLHQYSFQPAAVPMPQSIVAAEMVASSGVPTEEKRNRKKPGQEKKGATKQRKPYNNYNLFFMLEREKFLQNNGTFPIDPTEAGVQRSDNTDSDIDYSDINIPPFPLRYAALTLPDDWYVNKKKQRRHAKTHGSSPSRK